MSPEKQNRRNSCTAHGMRMECKIYAENDHTADSAKMNSRPGRSFSQASFPDQSTFLQLGENQ
jgi:hypothetical protein